MKKYKGIIFDLDGTLLDTIEDLGDSMNEALRILGYPTFEIEEYKLKVGGGFRGLALNCLPDNVEEDLISKTIDLFAEIYDKNFLNKTRPYEAIDELLDKLNSKGILLAVNSNKKDEYTRILVDKFFKRIPFVKVYGEREGLPKKPDPYSALEIMAEMGLAKEEILFIGDSKTDILTANNAGMDSIGVLWGFRGRDEFIKYGATYIVERPEEILSFV
ncbi:MAG: HAD family hydrolase [Tissierellia bacterium]|nr:HAD family hydrolase [Tissierellia bacterium]